MGSTGSCAPHSTRVTIGTSPAAGVGVPRDAHAPTTSATADTIPNADPGRTTTSSSALKERQVFDRLAERQLRHDLPNDGRELEAMAGTRARDHNLAVDRMVIDHEMTIDRIRVQTHGAIAQLACRMGKKALHECTSIRVLLLVDGATNTLGIGELPVVMHGDLDSITKVGDGVEHPLRRFPEGDWQPIRRKFLRMLSRPKPVLHLALDREMNLRAAKKLGKPWAEGEYQAIRHVLAHCRGDTHHATLDSPRQHWLRGTEHRPVACGAGE